MILLTGFGPFGAVVDNPSARLVRAVHGRVAFGHRILSEVLDVDWQRALPRAVSLERDHRPVILLGFGVASTRSEVEVETIGRSTRAGGDIRGQHAASPWPGHDEVHATVHTSRLAAALGAQLSTDAGTYLCNGWLHQVVPAVSAPATFIHIPPRGMDPQRLLRGLHAYLADTDSPRQRDSAAATS